MSPLTHVLFDFFGTLVDYTAGRGDHVYERSLALVERAGTRLERGPLLALWDETYARFEAEAAATHREFSMQQVCGAFLRRAGVGAPPERLVRDFARTYVAEWNAGVRDKPGVPELLERLAVSPERCAFVGDSFDADFQGAAAAGMRAFLIDPLAASPAPGKARLGSRFALESRPAALD